MKAKNQRHCSCLAKIKRRKEEKMKILFSINTWLLFGAMSQVGAGIKLLAGDLIVASLFAIHGILCYILWAILK